MKGEESTIWKRYNDAIKYIHQLKGFENCEIFGPQNIKEFNPETNKNFANSERKFSYGTYISADIKILIDDCTDILMCKNWIHSSGCNIEYQVAKILNKNIIFMHY